MPGNTLKIPDSEIQRRVELARRSEFSGFCRPVVDNDITFWMNKNLEADILAEKSQCDTIFRLLKSLGPMFTILKKLWNGKQLGGTAPVQVYAFNEEHKADNFHNLVRFIKDFCYAWGKPRPIHESGGILDFLFLRNGPVDHNNLSRFESVLLHQYVKDPTMMGGSKHFDAILGSMREARREASKTATKACTGSGDTTWYGYFNCI